MGTSQRPGVLAIWGYGQKTRPRQLLPHAPTCFKRNSDALARLLNPMPSTPTTFFISLARFWA